MGIINQFITTEHHSVEIIISRVNIWFDGTISFHVPMKWEREMGKRHHVMGMGMDQNGGGMDQPRYPLVN